MKTRREIIIDNQKIKTKRLLTKIQTGIALFAAGAVLNQVTSENPEVLVQAQTNSPTQFLGLISDSARRIAASNDLYASVMIAQAALESGWGNSGLAQAPNYNLFGIKGSYNGNTVVKDTLEDDGSGNYYQIQDGFRRYDNYAQSLEDYASVLTGDHDPNSWRNNFYSGARKSNTNTYQDATAHLTGRYATDTSYGSKLNKIIEQYGLTEYDASNGSSMSSYIQAQSSSGNVSGGSGSYVVQAGDSLYAIARRHGISLDTLLANSGLSVNTTIHPGQVINVGVSAANTTSDASETPSVSTRSVETPQTTTVAASGTYTVKAGDGLYRIATNHGMTLDQLKALNGLTSNFIHPGQSLKVSGSVPTAPAVSSTVAVADNTPASQVTAPVTYAANGGGTYTVQAGDGLYRIAANHGMSLEQLKALNGLSSNLIHPGQVLNVSGSAVATPSPAPQVYTQETVTVTEYVPETYSDSTTAVASGQTYTIQAGDTLYAISRKFGVNVHDLIARYGHETILPGQVITIY